MTQIKYRDGMLAARYARPMNTRPLRPAETLNLAEAAEFLGVSTKWLRTHAQQERVPCRKIGSRWLFSRTVLVQWQAGQWKKA